MLLKEIPTTGLRLYNYFDDGKRNTVGALECGRYVFVCDHALWEIDLLLRSGGISTLLVLKNGHKLRPGGLNNP